MTYLVFNFWSKLKSVLIKTLPPCCCIIFCLLFTIKLQPAADQFITPKCFCIVSLVAFVPFYDTCLVFPKNKMAFETRSLGSLQYFLANETWIVMAKAQFVCSSHPREFWLRAIILLFSICVWIWWRSKKKAPEILIHLVYSKIFNVEKRMYLSCIIFLGFFGEQVRGQARSLAGILNNYT